LWADINVWEEHIFIFRVEVCSVRNGLGYICKLQESGHGTQGEGVKKRTQSDKVRREK
jgi:hypothetical protein